MKRYFAAAGALLLSSSALAWSADGTKPVDTAATPADSGWDKTELVAKDGADKMLLAAKTGDAKFETAAFTQGFDEPAEVKFASAETVDKTADVKLASADMLDKAADGEAKLALADSGKADLAMGGPLEEPTGYPACRPGPGDDRCIQLYEPGVRAQLAAWKASEADDVAMGGPFEPVEDDVSVASSSVAADADLAHHDSHAGMGGPIEAQSGYPPCSPGPGDDRCIQLYERGVTGAGN